MVLPWPSDFVGTALGATKSPVLEINPNFWLPPVTPFTCQVTAALELPVTVAVNCWVRKSETDAVAGSTETCTAELDTTVTVAEPDLVVSAWEVAVTVTFAGLGTVAGAVYTPIDEIVPPPLTLQVTAWLFVPVTVALKVNV